MEAVIRVGSSCRSPLASRRLSKDRNLVSFYTDNFYVYTDTDSFGRTLMQRILIFARESHLLSLSFAVSW